jgi:hypothetical protein
MGEELEVSRRKAMHKKLTRACYTIIAVACLSGSQCTPQEPSDSHPAAAATQNAPTQDSAETWTSPAPCSGGDTVRANPSNEDQNMALSLVYAIRSWRLSQNMSGLYDPAAQGVRTVAFYHAEDMNGNSYVNLVASDGENVTQHLACMDGAIRNGGAVVVGQSNNVTDVLNYMTSNNAALSVLSLNRSHIAVGYSNGYWCVIIY